MHSPSITLEGLNEPFELQVARGQILGHSTLNIYGFQPSVGTSFIPIWENAAAYVYPASATQMKLSGSNGDTAQILISGLDANYVMISETVTLNGSTPVTTAKSFLRINGMQVTVGSATNPAGAVTLTDLTGAVVYAKINAGVGRTQAGIYTVPAKHTFFLQRVNIYTSLNGNDYCTYQNKSISPTGVVSLTQQAPFPTSYEARRISPRPIPEKTDIQLLCKIQTGTGAVAVSQEGFLVEINP